MISVVLSPYTITDFPATSSEPDSYYRGVDVPMRIRSRNAVVFMRNSRANLQQSRLSNLSHHRHVLIVVIETAGVVSLEGSRIPLASGNAVLVLPYQFHHYIELSRESLRWLFVTFEVEAGEDDLEALGRRVLRPDEDTFQLLRQIVRMWNGREAGRSGAELLATLDRLLIRLAEGEDGLVGRPRTSAVSPDPSAASWIARAESLVVKSLKEGWTIRRIAEELNVSERHFRTRFRAETGVNIRRYRANIQLHRAIVGMKESHLSIGQIAELGGFQSQAVFTRFIQRETGRSPTECRRLLRSGALDEVFSR